MNNEEHFYALRGKTDRRRNRNRINQKQKELIQLDKKSNLLFKQRTQLGLEELEKPYQKGFKRFFVLRDITYSEKQIAFYNELLSYINTKQLSLRKDFKKRKRIRRKKVYVEMKQKLQELTWHYFKKLPDKFKPYFIRTESIGIKTKDVTVNYIYSEPWRFCLKVEPNIITHQHKIDSVLNGEIQKLNNQIERKYLHPKIAKSKSKKLKYKRYGLKKQEVLVPIYKLIKQNEQD